MTPGLRIGTRGSQLALYQAELVRSLLIKASASLQVEIVKIKTSGDLGKRGAPNSMETKRIYTREIEEALLAGDVDVAVHSAKDLAAEMPAGLKIGAVLEREDPRDCLVTKDGKKLADFKASARIGTSSLRRKMQILKMRPDLKVDEVHGNVDTRVKKAGTGEFDGLVLAAAGLKRLDLLGHASEIFEEDRFYPAPGQGAIVVQSRETDARVDGYAAPLNHQATAVRLECERAFLKRLDGGCQLPCGITTKLHGDRLFAAGALFALTSGGEVKAELEGAASSAGETGRKLAEMILAAGGDKILEQIRHGEK